MDVDILNRSLAWCRGRGGGGEVWGSRGGGGAGGGGEGLVGGINARPRLDLVNWSTRAAWLEPCFPPPPPPSPTLPYPPSHPSANTSASGAKHSLCSSPHVNGSPAVTPRDRRVAEIQELTNLV